jgi:clan AA aspartic protease
MMGITFLNLEIANPQKPRKRKKLKFLVDTGATYSVVPEPVLRQLGIKPGRVLELYLADGTSITRRRGNALFAYKDLEAPAPVMFGEEGDSTLLGVTTLECLGLVFDPVKRELRPMHLMLAQCR